MTKRKIEKEKKRKKDGEKGEKENEFTKRHNEREANRERMSAHRVMKTDEEMKRKVMKGKLLKLE